MTIQYATGEVVSFDGFLKVYLESTDDEEHAEDSSHILPALKEGDELQRREILATEKYSLAPARYTEASLVKKLEDLGIGRPSTYAPTISTIQQRQYVVKGDKTGEERTFTIDSLKGIKITQKLKKEMAGSEKCECSCHPSTPWKRVNYLPEDRNYDLYKLACKVTARRFFPNFLNLDATFNQNEKWRADDPERYKWEIATMGCRTRVIGNVNDPEREITYGRGNLSFTSINLPRLAIESHGDEKLFYEKLQGMLELVAQQLLDRFEIQASKHVYNYPFLMGQGVWLDSEKLGPDDEVREVLKHGTLSIGFIGLAETLKALTGKHHGESEESWKLGLEIISHMREKMDEKSRETGLNFTLLATPAEGLSGRFVRIDQKKYGKIPGVTDREYYTNSFHVPVYYPISAYEKIRREAPFHALTNAGHISYVELDGDTCKNIDAFESIVRCMKENGIGYRSTTP